MVLYKSKNLRIDIFILINYFSHIHTSCLQMLIDL